MEALGIDFKLFLGQIINFLILLFILWRFAYRPVLKMLNDRREKIADSLENAKRIEENLAESEQKTREAIRNAQIESEKMIENAKKLAVEQRAEIIEIAKTQAGKETEKAKLAIAQEKNQASIELKKEMAQLVGLATEKILAKKADSDLQTQAINEAIEELK
ncbi:MAG: atpF [Candidatus Berkelbacteria bacterium]|nr:atpF [Candidatus Berkelbacteria bacterium]